MPWTTLPQMSSELVYTTVLQFATKKSCPTNANENELLVRGTDWGYHACWVSLAKASGIETPTREDLAKIDMRCPIKGFNQD